MTTMAVGGGMTVRQLARFLRVSPDKVRAWIRAGQLAAINTAEPLARPRFVILPEHLAEFEKRRRAVAPPKPARAKKRRVGIIDFYPN